MAKKPKKSGRQNKYDWNEIMMDYCSDPNATLRSICEKYGVSMDAVAKKSKADSWFATRKKTQKRIVAKAITKRVDKQANELAKEMNMLAMMQGHIDKALQDKAQFNRHVKVDPVTGDLTDVVLDKVDTRAAKDIMQTLKMIEEMSRSLYNIQKAETIQKHQLDAERMQLDRERFEFEKQKAESNKPDTSGAVIRIEGFDSDWAD